MEKVIETNCLADIIIEAGKRTNIPYLRGGESLIREVLKEISQSRMIKKKQLKIFYYVILAAPIFFTLSIFLKNLLFTKFPGIIK